MNTNTYEWSFSQIAIAIVPGSTNYHALAEASVAFRLRGGVQRSDESFELIYDFSEEPSRTYTNGWSGTLPDAVRLHSDAGTALFDRAKDKTEWIEEATPTINQDRQPNQDPNRYIFLEEGTAVTSKSDLEPIRKNLQKTSDESEVASEDLWVVPAVLYSQSVITEDKTIRYVVCSSCGQSQHAFDGVKTDEPPEKSGLWICLNCHGKTKSKPPQDYHRSHDEMIQQYRTEDLEYRDFIETMEQLAQEGNLE